MIKAPKDTEEIGKPDQIFRMIIIIVTKKKKYNSPLWKLQKIHNYLMFLWIKYIRMRLESQKTKNQMFENVNLPRLSKFQDTHYSYTPIFPNYIRCQIILNIKIYISKFIF